MQRIAPGDGWIEGAYAIYASSAQVAKEWDSLVASRPKDAKRCWERLSSAPLEHYPGRQFPLRGESNKPFWEYEVSAGDRVIYGVKDRVVVISAGPHVKEDNTGAIGGLVARRRDGFDSYMPDIVDEATPAKPEKRRKRKR